MNKMFIEMWTVKAILTSMVHGGKVICVINYQKNLAELCSDSRVLRKVQLKSNKIVYLTEKFSKQSVEDVALFLLTAYSKMWKERNDLKMNLLTKKELEIKDLENSQPFPIAKNERPWWEENTRCVAK